MTNSFNKTSESSSLNQFASFELTTEEKHLIEGGGWWDDLWKDTKQAYSDFKQGFIDGWNQN